MHLAGICTYTEKRKSLSADLLANREGEEGECSQREAELDSSFSSVVSANDLLITLKENSLITHRGREQRDTTQSKVQGGG